MCVITHSNAGADAFNELQARIRCNSEKLQLRDLIIIHNYIITVLGLYLNIFFSIIGFNAAGFILLLSASNKPLHFDLFNYKQFWESIEFALIIMSMDTYMEGIII